MRNNPIINKYVNNFEAIPFSKIVFDDYESAFNIGIDEAYSNIEILVSSTDTPDFNNTILYLENISPILDKFTNVYYNLYALNSDSQFKDLTNVFSPKLAKLSGDIYTNEKIFVKVKHVYENSNELTLEQNRLVSETYLKFTRNGALLNKNEKVILLDIDNKLSTLGPKFSKNILDATNSFEIYINDKNRVSGIPEIPLNAASHLAKSKGYSEGWIFNLQMPSYLPVLQYCDDRTLRKELSIAYGIKNLSGDFDNRELIIEIIKLKNKRAKLLGYNNHADYTLKKRMAQSSETVNNFLNKILEVAHPAAIKEIESLKDYAKKTDNITDFQSWDYQYYLQKLKKETFNFDPEQLRPYFSADNVINGIFTVANKLYGLEFNEISNIEKYFEEINVYKVTDLNNEFIGLLYIDLYPRKTKQNGAWMNTFKTQGLEDGIIKRPHVLISGNLTPPTPDTPSLLSFNDVRTLFHEFGHALHGLLSNVTYKSLASSNVYWDFVELPSQIMENWLFESETLQFFAKHYKTGEIIPQELVDKIKNSSNFDAGYMNNRQISLGLLDMAWYTADPDIIDDIEKFEKKVMNSTRLLPENESNISTSFSHIFSGGYSAGYYSYKWAEVLDADAFEYFKQNGIFNKEVAESFKDNILSKGNTEDPMILYKKFRGKEPDPEALLRRDGLL